MKYSSIFCSLLVLAQMQAADAPGPLAPVLQLMSS